MVEVTEEFDLRDIQAILNENVNTSTIPSNITHNTVSVPKQDHSQMVRALNKETVKNFHLCQKLGGSKRA